jgi:RNA polymerase sigma-70 factor (ECF subfamily)
MEKNVTAAEQPASLNYEVALLECAAGREAAVAGIYQIERNRLRGVVRRIVRNRDDVEDVIHDAFVQILKDARSFDPARGSARAWIYTIVRNTALKSCRNAAREVAIDADKLVAIHDCDQMLAEPASRMEEYAALRGCLEALEPQRRASLILAIIDGRTHAEVAAYLGVPLGTVKSWIRRELIALRAHLK